MPFKNRKTVDYTMRCSFKKIGKIDEGLSKRPPKDGAGKIASLEVCLR